MPVLMLNVAQPSVFPFVIIFFMYIFQCQTCWLEFNNRSKMDWSTGDLVWFDPSIGHPLPGEILEVHRAAQVIIVQAMINGKVN